MTTSPPTDKSLSCYDCNHRLVCKYYAAIPGVDKDFLFPYKSDSHIKPLLETVSVQLAQACNYFDKDPCVL